MRRLESVAVRAGAQVLGVLPDRMGQFRIAQRYWWFRQPGHQILAQRLADGTQLRLDLGDRTQALAYLTRRYSEELIRQIESTLPKSGRFFDVGANVGLVTFQVAHRRPDVEIVAFEPNPLAVTAWRRNWELTRRPSVILEPSAVADVEGVVRLASPASDLGAGLVASGDDGIPVSAITLDQYCAASGIDHVDVMKVDVEGYEPEVLRGMRELLGARAVRFLLLEFNPGHFERRQLSRAELLRWLDDHRMVPASPVDGDDVAFVPAD